MNNNSILYTDEYIQITSNQNELYIESYRKGFPSERLKGLLDSNPQIDIQDFNVIKQSIQTAPASPQKFGILKEPVVVEIVENSMKAFVTFNLSKEALEIANRGQLIKSVSAKLKGMEIVYGIKSDLFLHDLVNSTPYLIAEGTPPINGEDSKITMYRLEASRPEVHEDGSVDFYELKLINRVKSGDWLGERIDPTDGTAGTNIKGEPIPPAKGKLLALNYDKNSVTETSENGVTTLYSRVNGAVSYSDGRITVSNHLEIQGDVDFRTGNINFDGYLTIKGTIADGFSVQATKDIEVNGELGLGNIKSVISTHGSIFIKGGIAARRRVEIHAAKSVFVKFIDNVHLVCGEKAHVGFYSINSDICGNEVIIDSPNGHIIGGTATAKVRIVSPFLGSEVEKRTVIEVTGFEKDELKHELELTFHQVSELKNEQQLLKTILAHFDSKEAMDPFKRKEYDEHVDRSLSIKDQLRELEEKKKLLGEYMKTHGEGEIVVSKKIFPKCLLIIKKIPVEITASTPAGTYYFQDGIIKQIQ